MAEAKSSYRQAFKATSIFGGVQALKIGISLFRSKFVAVLLGPTGTGINGLLNSPLGLIGSFTGLGISFSAIRDLSESYAANDPERFARTLIIFRRWIWATGILGMVVTLILAPFLSVSSFGDHTYTWAFVILSSTFVINSISSGQGSVLYATRRIKDTSQSALYGNILGVLTSIPLYYFFGIKGIVPALLIASITNLILTWHFSRKIKTEKVAVSLKETFWDGLSFAKVGFAMMLSGILGSAVTYLISVFLSHIGGVEQVGLYNSGWNITEQFVGMVFAAMAADYFPRLAGVNRENEKVIGIVNEQAEIALLLLGPIMLVYLLSLPLIIRLLLTEKYLPILSFAQWVVIGMLLKALGWSMGYIALAQGRSVLFFRIELVTNIINTLNVMGGYYLFGLEGVGVAFFATYLFYVAYLYIYYRKSINFRFTNKTKSVFTILQLFMIGAFLSVKFLPSYLGYTITFVFLIISSFYSYKILSIRLSIDIIRIFKERILKIRGGVESKQK